MTAPIGTLHRSRRGSRAALVVSLILHGIFAVVLGVLLLMKTDVYQTFDSLGVVWIENLSEPTPVKRRLKTPIRQRLDDPEKPIALKDPDKLMKQARNRLTEVARLSERRVTQDVEKNAFDRATQIPDLMTAAEMTLATDVTSIAKMQSLPGRDDGKGKPTGRTRVRGNGLGSLLYNTRGTGEGLLGGGGRGVRDPLKILDFLRGRGEQGRIVYVLDISASMGAAGLHKLDLAKASLLDHLYLLNEKDSFNIVTFSSTVNRMSRDLMPATSDNLTKAAKYLDRFTQESIMDQLGTNTLGAIEAALAMKPDVVVLLTDGVPTSAKGKVVETDPEKIVQIARAKNVSNAALFIVGLEIDNLGGPGELLLKELAQQTGGRIKFVGRDELLRYRDRAGNVRN